MNSRCAIFVRCWVFPKGKEEKVGAARVKTWSLNMMKPWLNGIVDKICSTGIQQQQLVVGKMDWIIFEVDLGTSVSREYKAWVNFAKIHIGRFPEISSLVEVSSDRKSSFDSEISFLEEFHFRRSKAFYYRESRF